MVPPDPDIASPLPGSWTTAGTGARIITYPFRP